MIVGVGYKKRRGKDTSADALVRELGFYKFGFADALKQLALEADPIVVPEPAYQNVRKGHNTLRYVVERQGWDYVKDHYPEARLFLQHLGEGARKVFGDDFWIGQLFERFTVGDDVVVPDVRYINEAEAIKAAGGFLIRIDRTVPGADDSHSSETELDGFDGWDAVVDNSGSVLDLERRIVEIVRGFAAPAEVAA